MKTFKKIACIVFILNILFNLKIYNYTLGIFDTTNLDEKRYDNFIKLAESVGFKTEYKSYAQILEQNIDLNKYDGIFFILGIEFLKGIKNSNIPENFLKILQEFSQKEDKLIGLVLPSIISDKIKNKSQIFIPIIKRTTILDTQNNFDNIELFFKQLDNFLDRPFEGRGKLYCTSLNLKQDFISLRSSINNTSNKFFTTLPLNQDYAPEIKLTLPYGLYIFNQAKKNHLFITSNLLTTFSGIDESFHFGPTDPDKKRQIHTALQQTLWELFLIVNQNSYDLNNSGIDYDALKEKEKPDLPIFIKNFGINNLNKNNTNNNFKTIGWFELNIFDPTDNPQDKDKNKKQNILINACLQSKLDYLWITLNPHMYYSPIARLKDKTENFYKTLSLFTKKLNSQSIKLNFKSPEILIGYEITNNTYEPNLPQDHAVDLYNNSKDYIDIPNPLNNTFWTQEIKNPLIEFLKKYNNPEINNSIKIAGVILDLEMYCRKTTGSFLDTMGFEQTNISNFLESKKLKNINPEINGLINNKMLIEYIDFLQQQAKLLGQDLKSFFEKQIPNCFIACYAPTISIEWFYKNFYSGLSSKDNPIYLLTFNTEFNAHKKYLEDNNIFIKHSSVLMLSKIKNSRDFRWIDFIEKNHDSVWFNRFSRFSENYHNSAWMSIEQSPMNNTDKNLFFSYLLNKKNKFLNKYFNK